MPGFRLPVVCVEPSVNDSLNVPVDALRTLIVSISSTELPDVGVLRTMGPARSRPSRRWMVAEALTARLPDALRLTKLVMALMASGRFRPRALSCERSKLNGRARPTLKGMSRLKFRTPVLVSRDRMLVPTSILVSATRSGRSVEVDENLPWNTTW